MCALPIDRYQFDTIKDAHCIYKAASFLTKDFFSGPCKLLVEREVRVIGAHHTGLSHLELAFLVTTKLNYLLHSLVDAADGTVRLSYATSSRLVLRSRGRLAG